MAGDWIKLQKDTPDKPEVLAIAGRMGIDPDAVVGKLVRIWSWFDTHTTDGNASCVTFALLDRLAGVTGFAEQMALVGWLEQNGHLLTLPNFEFHNGETSKKRALGKNRQDKLRSNANSDASSVTKASPEKRREDINTVAPSAKSPQGSALPGDWVLPEDWATWARSARPDIDPAAAAESFRDYWVARPGKDGRKSDWQATWRNWIRSQRASPSYLAKPDSSIGRFV